MWHKVRPARHLTIALANQAPVRTTRSRIIHLKNDYKALMNVIEKHIHEHFARQAELAASEEPTNGTTPMDMDINTSSSSARAPQVSGPPFAKVNSVVDGSPADSAGLKAGDEIRTFGYVSYTNHDGLKRVGECVQGNEGVSQLILVVRSMIRANRCTARDSSQSLSSIWCCSTTGTAIETHSSTGLGWPRAFGLSYTAIVRC